MSSASPIAFIGGGNMARSLIGGLIARGTAVDAIRVSEPVDVLREGPVSYTHLLRPDGCHPERSEGPAVALSNTPGSDEAGSSLRSE